jgi:hypothetical protein
MGRKPAPTNISEKQISQKIFKPTLREGLFKKIAKGNIFSNV